MNKRNKKVIRCRLQEIFFSVIEVEDDELREVILEDNSQIQIDSLTFIRFLVAVEEEYAIEFSESALSIDNRDYNSMINSLIDEVLKMNLGECNEG